MKNEAATPTEEAEPKAFSQFLLSVGEGDCHEQLSAELLNLSRSIIAQGRAQAKPVKGTLVLKLNLTGDDGILDVTYSIERKEPKPRRPRSTFWFDKAGNIVNANPKQIELGLRDVSKGRDKPKEAPSDKAPAREG